MKKNSKFNNSSQKKFMLLSTFLFFMILILTLSASFINKLKANKTVNSIESKQTISEHQGNTKNIQYVAETKIETNKKSETETISKQPKKFVMPTSGEMLVGFSESELIYNHTTKDWRTHNGIDISVTDGALVKSMNDGKIIDIKSDVLLGNIISIEHSDKIIISYCNIDICKELNIGDTVTQGMLIGYANNNPPFESEQPLHLHIEIFKDNILSDLSVLDFQ